MTQEGRTVRGERYAVRSVKKMNGRMGEEEKGRLKDEETKWRQDCKTARLQDNFLLTSWQIWRFAHRIQVILNSKKPKIGFLSLNNHAIGQNLINSLLNWFVDCKNQKYRSLYKI